MRVLLIGGTGFLGRHVFDRFTVTPGIEVVTAGRSRVAGSTEHHGLDLFTDDVAKVAALLSEVAPDAVVNCAGAVAGEIAVLEAGNVAGPATLVRAMLRNGSQARLVHLGSAGEYGRVDTGVAITERTATCPVSVYGATKLAGTRIIQVGWEAGLDTVVLRVFNPVGPGSPVGSLPGRLVAEVSRALTDGDDVRLGPLGAVRDFVDARDVAVAVARAVEMPVVDSPVLNIAGGVGRPVRELVTLLLDIAGYTGAVEESGDGSTRSADVPWQQADIGAAERTLGWAPRIDLHTSLDDLWRTAR